MLGVLSLAVRDNTAFQVSFSSEPSFPGCQYALARLWPGCFPSIPRRAPSLTPGTWKALTNARSHFYYEWPSWGSMQLWLSAWQPRHPLHLQEWLHPRELSCGVLKSHGTENREVRT